MKGGILEVLLVSAEGIGYTNIIGKPKYFVILQCGNQVYKSKTSKGNSEEIRWNEKFTFEFRMPEMENQIYLKLQIKDEECFTDGGLVGETTIYLKGIITEAKDNGFMEVRPAPYNVVLEDDTFKGQIRIGLKYISNKMAEPERMEYEQDETGGNGLGHSKCKAIVNLWKILWKRFFSSNNTDTNSISKQKPN